MPDLLVQSTQLSTLSEAPAQSAEAVTPHDTNAQSIYRSLWVGGTGNIQLLLVNDSVPVTILAVPNGTLIPFAVKRVYATNTTATNIIGLK